MSRNHLRVVLCQYNIEVIFITQGDGQAVLGQVAIGGR